MLRSRRRRAPRAGPFPHGPGTSPAGTSGRSRGSAPRCAVGGGGRAASSPLPAAGLGNWAGSRCRAPRRVPLASGEAPPAAAPALPPRPCPQTHSSRPAAPLPPPAPPQRARRRHFVYLPPPPGPAALPPLPPPGLAPPWRPTCAPIGRHAGPSPARSPTDWLRRLHEGEEPAVRPFASGWLAAFPARPPALAGEGAL